MAKKTGIDNRRPSRVLMYFYLFFLVMSVIVIIEIYQIQNSWEPNPKYKKEFVPQKHLENILPREGTIMDCNGRVLAISTPQYNIFMDCCVQKEHYANDKKEGKKKDNEWLAKADELSGGLARVLSDSSKDSTYYSKLIRSSREGGARHVLIAAKVDHKTVARLKELPLFNEPAHKGGLIIEPVHNRMHPYNGLAKRIIGHINKNIQNGFVGIEGRYYHEIKGIAGTKWAKHTDNFEWISDIDSTSVDAQDGMDVRTTLDIHIQEIADRSLRHHIDTFRHINGACAVIMDVKTGGVKAMVNLKRDSKGKLDETFNYAIGWASEPGSVFKTIMLTTLLEDNHVTLNERMLIDVDKMHYPGWKTADIDDKVFNYKNKSGRTHIPVIDGFMVSSNYVLRRQVTDHYYKNPEELITRLHSYHLGGSFDFEIKENNFSRPSIPSPGTSDWSESTIPGMAIGYNVKVTPLQILSFYNGLANEGKMMQPYIVESFEKDGKIVEKRGPTLLSAICSKATADTMVRAMTRVTKRIDWGNGSYTTGTAYESMKGAKCTVAGKTGSAWITLDEKDRVSKDKPYESKDGRRKYQATFAGFFPAENPQYSMIVVVYTDLIKKMEGGGDKPAKVFKQVVDELWAYGYIGQKEIKGKHKMPDINVLDIELDENKQIPNLIGLGLRDALNTIEKCGYKCEHTGFGHVVKQENNGETIKITLK